jgi:hypothetical protein
MREPTYIETIAQEIFWEAEAEDHYDPEDAPLWLGYAVLCLAKGTETTSRDVHDAWSAWAVVAHNGEHRSLIPFEQLTPKVQAYDDRYRDAIHAVAARLAVAR